MTIECMLDLETLGVRPGSAIRSVGAASFELGGDGAVDTFYVNVRSMSCWVAGLTVDKSTLDWWEKQSPAARDALKTDPRDLAEVVDSFHRWYTSSGCAGIWCQGAGFDEVLWGRAAGAVGRAVPWKYWQARCTRTIYHVASFDPNSVPREGVHHGALDDALHQVRCVQAAYKKITRGSAVTDPGLPAPLDLGSSAAAERDRSVKDQTGEAG